jgi:hypothetical protein
MKHRKAAKESKASEVNLHDSLLKSAVSCLTEELHYPRSCRDSVVDRASRYGLGGPGIQSRWCDICPAVQSGLQAHPVYCTGGNSSFPGTKRPELITYLHQASACLWVGNITAPFTCYCLGISWREIFLHTLPSLTSTHDINNR